MTEFFVKSKTKFIPIEKFVGIDIGVKEALKLLSDNNFIFPPDDYISIECIVVQDKYSNIVIIGKKFKISYDETYGGCLNIYDSSKTESFYLYHNPHGPARMNKNGYYYYLNGTFLREKSDILKLRVKLLNGI